MAMSLEMSLQGDGAFPGLPMEGREVVLLGEGSVLRVAGLPGEAEGGKGKPVPAKALIVLDLPDGRVVIAETTVDLFVQAAEHLKARFGEAT